jgi:hypothetical protein
MLRSRQKSRRICVDTLSQPKARAEKFVSMRSPSLTVPENFVSVRSSCGSSSEKSNALAKNQLFDYIG